MESDWQFRLAEAMITASRGCLPGTCVAYVSDDPFPDFQCQKGCTCWVAATIVESVDLACDFSGEGADISLWYGICQSASKDGVPVPARSSAVALTGSVARRAINRGVVTGLRSGAFAAAVPGFGDCFADGAISVSPWQPARRATLGESLSCHVWSCVWRFRTT